MPDSLNELRNRMILLRGMLYTLRGGCRLEFTGKAILFHDNANSVDINLADVALLYEIREAVGEVISRHIREVNSKIVSHE